MKDIQKNKEYKYIYCIINKNIKKNFGKIGINENRVYTIPYEKFSIIINDCSVKEIKDKKNIDLAIEHQYVVDAMMKKFNTLIPFNAGTLIKEENIKNWIDKNYKKFLNIFKKIKNKQEFGIQIFYNITIKKRELTDKVKDYINKQKNLREELMVILIKYKGDFYNQISEIADEVKNIEINQSSIDKQMLLNLACLVDKNKIEKLTNYLKKINNNEFSVNFNGPWAPYSFVS